MTSVPWPKELIIPRLARPAIWLSAIQGLECCLGENDLREWRLEDLDDLGSAPLMSPNPAVVANAEFLPAQVRYKIEQIRIVAAGQVGS